jgi:predicted MFS family arabinose efflux permease
VLARSIGVPGIFLLTGLLGLVAMAVVRWVVPEPQPAAPLKTQRKTPLGQLLRQPDLARINFGIFVLQAVLMAMWVVVPFDMRQAGLQARDHWLIYLPVLVGSVALMLPPMLLAERRGKQKVALLGGIAVLIFSEAALALGRHSLWGIGVALLLFFAAFNLLEASLPALISRTAPSESKGTAIGIYSSVQFLGTFTGGVAGGFVSQHLGGTAVFALCGIAALSWLMIAARMRLPGAVRTHTYPVPQMDETRAQGLSHRLAGLPGVREARVRPAEGVALLKVDSVRFEEKNVLKLLSGEV